MVIYNGKQKIKRNPATRASFFIHHSLCLLYCDFLALVVAGESLLYIQRAQKPTKPTTVTKMPESQGQAPEMT